MYTRPLYQTILERLAAPRVFMQVLAGPRQVGKTTLAHQIRKILTVPSHYASSDGFSLRNEAWIEEQWELGRRLAKESTDGFGALLVLDEIQKIPLWSDVVKKLWDQDSADCLNLKVMILGSSSLLIQTGLGESLAGRFELIPISHWSFQECRDAFDWDLDKYIYFGGYPAAAMLIKDEERWSRYIIDALIETSISRDIMLMTRIHKPALLRRVFELGCIFTGEVVSYQKMLGQLQDAGNAATLAHYLELLSGAGLVSGLQKFSLNRLQQKASSPKFQVLNTALTTAQNRLSFETTKQNRVEWHKLTECAVGAHLLNASFGSKTETFYWKENNKYVDFILKKNENLVVIEVNNQQKGKKSRGLEVFTQKFQPTKTVFIGEGGISVEEFLLTPLEACI
ncbi:MAG: ATP-binding protein [Alphaproteobacteria bacterium]|nr:ATP-binding protein [Alphaproteobacteria bacterium]